MSTIEARIAKAAGGWNSCYHNTNYGPRKSAARRANPDSIISSMAYDLTDGPVRITGETWPRYWSISFYQQNFDNFFVRNDRQLKDSSFDYILALPGQDTSDLSGQTILSPSSKGIMLIRRFAADPSDMPGILENQTEMTCDPVDNRDN
ncbi:MAG: DUF1254 domain-containing protein [Pseudomonadota bacterium]